MGFMGQLMKGLKKAVNEVDKAAGGKRTPADILASGEHPAKPSAAYESFEGGSYFAEDETGASINVGISFMHSGDFISVGDCGAGELDDVLLYAPQYDDSEKLYSDGDSVSRLLDNAPRIEIVSAPEDDIYEATEAYKATKTPFAEAMMFLPVDKGLFLYKAKYRNKHGEIVYFYAFDRKNTWDNCYIGAKYSPDIMGTALENKLIAAVDEIVSTYKEEIIG